MPAGTDRRLVACANHVVQIVGSVTLLMAAGENVALLIAGVLLFGVGIGNTTSLPPLIAQAEFHRGDALRVVSLIVAISQGTYAFAPAVFGALRGLSATEGAAVFIAAAILQGLAILAFAAGRRAVRPLLSQSR
jgi:MFS family permease